MSPDDDSKIPKNLDFSGGVRGKYAGRYAEDTIVVLLDSDVAAAYKTSKEVNEALRQLIRERSKKPNA